MRTLVLYLVVQLCLSTNMAVAQEPTHISSNADTVDQLAYIQNLIDQKLADRRQLGNQIANANEQDKADLRSDANALTNDIQQLRSTLESIATGGVDIGLFEDSGQKKKSDWREDVSLIAQPVLDSLKEITEKPRRIKELNELIELRTSEMQLSERAIEKLAAIEQEHSESLKGSLQSLERKWQKRLDDAMSAINVAEIQLANLQGNQSIGKSIYDALVNFATGRGLTILIAFAAAWLVWFAVRTLLKTYRHTLLKGKTRTNQTHYRLAKYSVQAFTFILILIAVFIVFYERHDVLLLGLLILLIVGFVLNARQLLPRYFKEARLLLNLGSMREGERVILNNIPYRVESINMHTVFRNPELSGILRLPLSELTQTYSRPIGQEQWFPSSKGDIMLTADGVLLEVLHQNPDTVELKKRGGELLSMPTADYYAMNMTNLTRFGSFGVTSQFGIDYGLQSLSLTKVPSLLREGLREHFQQSNLSEAVKDIRVELSAAGNSSIDYWIFLTMSSDVARSYFRVHRMIQSACIAVCEDNQWSIPFPHLSVIKKEDSTNTQLPDNDVLDPYKQAS